MAALMLATSAWNSSIGDDTLRNQHRLVVAHFDWDDETPWEELKSSDTEKLIAELVEYKKENFPDDFRHIIDTGMTPEGNFRVHWDEPDNLVAASFGASHSHSHFARPRPLGPIATKLVKKMKQTFEAKSSISKG